MISIVCFVYLLLRYIKSRSWITFEPVIILSGILLTAFIFELGITVFNSWLGNTWFYSSGMLPMIQGFEALAAAYALSATSQKNA